MALLPKKTGVFSWLESSDVYEKGVELTEEDINHFLANLDCYVMGSHTYETALKLGWPYGEVPVIVLTNRNLTSERENVHFYSGDLTSLVNERLKTEIPKYLAGRRRHGS